MRLFKALALLLVAGLTSPVAWADAAALAAKGKQLAQVCAGCHSLGEGEPHTVGPNLWQLLERPVASAEGYAYSEALRQAGGHWSRERLDRYLQSPAQAIPGNRMAFGGLPSVEERAAVIAYLATLKPGGPAVGEDADFDYGGLKAGEGRTDVYQVCSRCHSVMLVRQQGMSRSRWEEVLEWMIEEQGMDPLSDDQYQRVLSYLAAQYGS